MRLDEQQVTLKCVEPSFFKIINSTNIEEDGHLVIPKKFITTHGKYLPDFVVLKVPSGMAWRVEIRKTDGAVRFQNGWQEFSEHHSISHGHILVFRYDRKSEFLVLVFDMTGNEINYLSGSENLSQVSHVKENRVPTTEDGDDSIRMRDSWRRDLKTRRPLKASERNVVVQRSTAFKSKHPFFEITMTPSYVKSGCMPMPVTFSRGYIAEEVGRLTLQVSKGGKKWPVRFHTYNGYVKLTCLSAFVVENSIKSGDLCFFELINKKDGVLNFNVVSENRTLNW